MNGESSEYDGARNADGIVEWIKKMSGPAVKEEKPKGDEKLAIIFSGKEKSKVFDDFATKNRIKAKWFFNKIAEADKLSLKHDGEKEVVGEAKDF